MYCPNCGCTNDDNATVCENCGTTFESSEKNKFRIDAKKKKIIIISVIILLVVSVALAGIIGLALHKKSNSKNDFVNYPEVKNTTTGDITNDDTFDAAEDFLEDDEQEAYTEKSENNKSKSVKKEKAQTTKKSNQITNSSAKNNVVSTAKAVHTEYRYRDKSFTTSPNSSKYGWTLYDTTYSWSNYGSWSNWSTNSVSSNDSRQTESRTTYRFCVFRCTKCGNRDPYSTPCDNCGTSQYFKWEELWYPTKGNSMNKNTLSTVPDKYYVYIDGVKWWFERDGYSDGQGGIGQPSRKEYRYRDRKQVATYHFYKWGPWSEWSNTPVSNSADRQVETRKVN
ncbi:MAG: zinc ribbon domain-containing protein [Ruminococcus sp.]